MTNDRRPGRSASKILLKSRFRKNTALARRAISARNSRGQFESNNSKFCNTPQLLDYFLNQIETQDVSAISKKQYNLDKYLPLADHLLDRLMNHHKIQHIKNLLSLSKDINYNTQYLICLLLFYAVEKFSNEIDLDAMENQDARFIRQINSEIRNTKKLNIPSRRAGGTSAASLNHLDSHHFGQTISSDFLESSKAAAECLHATNQKKTREPAPVKNTTWEQELLAFSLM